jgi:hypothetical protein
MSGRSYSGHMPILVVTELLEATKNDSMITDTSVWEMLLLFYGYFMGPLDL